MWIVIIGILIFLAIIAFTILKSMTTVLPQEKRWIVYRLGRFNRIAGPGPVRVWPGLESVERELEVRNRPVEVTVTGIFAYKVPNDLTLNFWYVADLEEATKGDKEKQARLVQITESERRQQVEVKLREALVHEVAELQKNKPLPDGAGPLEGVAALAPGSERYNELLANIKGDLEKSLPTIGVVLDTSQPILVTKRVIAPDIIKAIQRKYGRDIDSQWLTRYAAELRKQFPDISRAVLAQVLSAVEGVDPGRVQRMLLEQERGSEADAEVEFEMPGNGEQAGPNIIAKPRPTPAHAPEAQPAAPPAQESAPSPGLSESDLAILKRVPRNGAEQKSA